MSPLQEESGCEEDEDEEEGRDEEEDFDSDESLVDSDSDSDEKGAFLKMNFLLLLCPVKVQTFLSGNPL